MPTQVQSSWVHFGWWRGLARMAPYIWHILYGIYYMVEGIWYVIHGIIHGRGYIITLGGTNLRRSLLGGPV